MEEPALGLVALARALYPGAQYGLQVTELETEGEDREGEHSERTGGITEWKGGGKHSTNTLLLMSSDHTEPRQIYKNSKQ